MLEIVNEPQIYFVKFAANFTSSYTPSFYPTLKGKRGGKVLLANRASLTLGILGASLYGFVEVAERVVVALEAELVATAFLAILLVGTPAA